MSVQLAPGLVQLGTERPDGECGAIYLIGGQGTEGLSEYSLIDAGTADNYSKLIRELGDLGLAPTDISTIYLTHGHSDHYEGARAFKQHNPMASIYVGQADLEAVQTGDYFRTAGYFYGRHSIPLPEAVSLEREYTRPRRFGKVLLRAYATPGHTPGSVSYGVYMPEQSTHVAILGDTAWGGWDEGHDRIGSDLVAWRESIASLLQVRPEFTHLSFGHGVDYLVKNAMAHLAILYQDIGKYDNAYRNIPDRNYQMENARAAAYID